MNEKADILFSCPVYSIGEAGTTVITEKPMLGPDQWLEIGAMEIYDKSLEYIDVAALEIVLLSSDQQEALIQDAKLAGEYVQL